MQYVRLLFQVETNGTIADKINNILCESVYISCPVVFVFYVNLFFFIFFKWTLLI